MANKICRVCLIDDGKTRNLFELNISLPDGELFPFHEMLSICCSFKFIRNMEQFICDKCILACTNAYIFIRLFQRNNESFLSLKSGEALLDEPEVKIEVIDEDLKPEEEMENSDPLFIDPNDMECETGVEDDTDRTGIGVDSKNHKCPSCPLIFRYYPQFHEHLKMHPDVKSCHICLQSCESTDDFEKHYYQVHYNFCDICNKSFLNRKRFWRHREIHHPRLNSRKTEKPAKCEIKNKHNCPACPTFNLSYTEFNKHLKKHPHIKTCNICNEDCKNLAGFQKHYHKSHYFFCNICKLSFPSRHKFNYHKTANHPELLKSSEKKRDLFAPNFEMVKVEAINSDNDSEKSLKSGIHKCPLCPLSFAFVPSFMKHVRTHANIESCNVCNVDCKNTDAFEEHYRQAHHNNCNICKIRFLTRKEYMRHMQSCHSNSKNARNSKNTIKLRKSNQTNHICPYCSVSMNKLNNFRVHLHFHVDYDQSPVTCTSCPVKCENLIDFYTHYINDHYIECGDCKVYFTSKDRLQNHNCKQRPSRRRIKLPLENPLLKFKCDICNEKFIGYNQLHYHRRKVHNLAKHLCSQCGQVFVNTAELKDHMWVHTGVKEHSCDKCKKQFTRFGALKQHVKKDMCTVKDKN